MRIISVVILKRLARRQRVARTVVKPCGHSRVVRRESNYWSWRPTGLSRHLNWGLRCLLVPFCTLLVLLESFYVSDFRLHSFSPHEDGESSGGLFKVKGVFSHVVISLIAWGYSVVAHSTHPLIHFSFISYSVYFFCCLGVLCRREENAGLLPLTTTLEQEVRRGTRIPLFTLPEL